MLVFRVCKFLRKLANENGTTTLNKNVFHCVPIQHGVFPMTCQLLGMYLHQILQIGRTYPVDQACDHRLDSYVEAVHPVPRCMMSGETQGVFAFEWKQCCRLSCLFSLFLGFNIQKEKARCFNINFRTIQHLCGA